MEDNIIITPTSTIIINGGNPLPGCPESWDDAYAIEKKLNEGKEENGEPLWDFDCGFKLDFDGPLISVCSRFYPPKTHYGSTWDGSVTVFLGDKDIDERSFDCATLDELKVQVESYIKEVSEKIIAAFTK